MKNRKEELMSKCKNCKHWHPFMYADMEVNYADCDKLNMDSSICEDAGVMVKDDDFEESSFKTGKNFGCIHFENK